MRPALHLALLACALLAPIARGAQPSWFRCTCSSATGTKPCVCPSTAAPGGLAPSDTPQFILFTHDDSILPETYKAITSIFDGRQSLDGCKAAATLFTTSKNTDCKLLKALHSAGYEVADHTISHPEMNSFTREQVAAEVMGARAKLASCGIPPADIVGFRQPYLQSSPIVRQVLAEAGFLYDSTILEEVHASLSSGPASRVFPYTMQDGIPQNCGWYAPEQTCNATERYPGMFEVPLWPLAAKGLYSMDCGADGLFSVFDILKANFDAAYSGNRAPLPTYIHTPWLSTAHVADMQRFAAYALSKPHVYFVTMRQLLAWMVDPIPAAALTPAAIGCGLPGGAGGVRAAMSPLPAASPPLPASPPPAASPPPSPFAALPPAPATPPAVDMSSLDDQAPAPAPAPAPTEATAELSGVQRPGSGATAVGSGTLLAAAAACLALALAL